MTDGNLDKKTFAGIAGLCGTYNIPLVFEPTSVPKAVLPVSADTLGALDIVKPNEKELVAVRPVGNRQLAVPHAHCNVLCCWCCCCC